LGFWGIGGSCPQGLTSTFTRAKLISMFTLKWRSLKAIASYWIEIGVAFYLLQYQGIKWFLFFWFIQTIFARSALYETNRCLSLVYQIGNECKLVAIMRSLGLTPADAQKIHEESKTEMTPQQIKHLEDDFRVAGF